MSGNEKEIIHSRVQWSIQGPHFDFGNATMWFLRLRLIMLIRISSLLEIANRNLNLWNINHDVLVEIDAHLPSSDSHPLSILQLKENIIPYHRDFFLNRSQYKLLIWRQGELVYHSVRIFSCHGGRIGDWNGPCGEGVNNLAWTLILG